MHFIIKITCTGRQFNEKQYSIFNEEEHRFPDLPSAQQFLKERYGKCKRRKIYIDGEDGQAQHVGYIYGFRNADYSHAPVSHWLQQDWVTLVERTEKFHVPFFHV